MPRFNTPGPISVTIEVRVADIRISSSDRTDTVVDVRPRNKSKASDVKAAEGTRVNCSNGRLQVAMPKSWTRFSFFSAGGAVDVTIDLPSGSSVHADCGMGAFDCEGRLATSSFKTGMGNITLDQTDTLYASTGYGEVSVDRVEGDADIATGSGKVRVRKIAGTALIKNSNGDTYLGDVGGDLRVKAANGAISVDRAHNSVTTKTANGGIRIGQVARGAIVLETALGELEVGIREGTAAWLDVHSQRGRVHNSLTATTDPDEAKEKVEVHARTHYGDILINRSPA
jgi:DUF4097 and DUF4098 domain-containing protein YvlB